jgi:hypothetical protein
LVSDPAIAMTSLPNRWMGFPHCDVIEAIAVQMQQFGHRGRYQSCCPATRHAERQ